MARRVRQYQTTLGRRTVVLKLRNFHTRATSRSRKFRQFVVACPFGPVREIALQYTVNKPSKRTPRRPTKRLQVGIPLGLLALGLTGSIFFAKQIFTPHALAAPQTFVSRTAPKRSAASAAPTVKPLPASVPTHISIPSVSIDADIITVGKNPDGTIQMPPLLSWLTGWYKFGPTPGQLGPAIIVGHVDNYKNISVFWRLRYVHPGDPIVITRTDGSHVTFTVTALKQVSQANFPTQEVYGNTSDPELRVITCGGTFDTATGSYDQNTVVYAVMAPGTSSTVR